jgi:hypothetical protein
MLAGWEASMGAERAQTSRQGSPRPLEDHDFPGAALRHDRIDAPWFIEGPIDGVSFRTYVEKVLLPVLRPGGQPRQPQEQSSSSAHRSVGAKLFFLPKYSRDLNPIEQVFAKLKHCSAKLPPEPSTRSAPQSATHSMPSPPMNAPTTSKIQAIELNAITL